MWICTKCGQRTSTDQRQCLSCGSRQPKPIDYRQRDLERRLSEDERLEVESAERHRTQWFRAAIGMLVILVVLLVIYLFVIDDPLNLLGPRRSFGVSINRDGLRANIHSH